MAKTEIQWSGDTWNPIRARNRKTKKAGHFCVKVSPGCKFCYAEGINRVWGTGLPYKPGHAKDVELYLDEKVLLAPLRWKPGLVFPCSMTDLFGDFVATDWIDRMFAVMYLTPHLNYQVLTKRSARMRAYINSARTRARVIAKARSIRDSFDRHVDIGLASTVNAIWPPSNAWLGVSIEDQRRLNRLEDLIDMPAAVKWVSFEPLLEDLGDIAALLQIRGLPQIDWAVIGLESRGARSPGLDPVRHLGDQLTEAGVPIFIKQLGTAWARLQNKGLKKDDPARVHSKGGEPDQWPAEFRVREFPAGYRPPA